MTIINDLYEIKTEEIKVIKMVGVHFCQIMGQVKCANYQQPKFFVFLSPALALLESAKETVLSDFHVLNFFKHKLRKAIVCQLGQKTSCCTFLFYISIYGYKCTSARSKIFGYYSKIMCQKINKNFYFKLF